MFLSLGGIVLVLAIATGTWALISHSRNRALAASERELGNVTVVLAEQTEQALRSLEVAQLGVVERLQALGISSSTAYERLQSDYDFHVMLKDRISGLSHVDAISMIDARGNLVNFSRGWPIPAINVADRNYFKALQSAPQLSSFVSEPIRSRASGEWTLYLARRVSSPTGEFLGVILGALKLEYFERFFATIALEPASSIALFRRDGTLLARHPRVDSWIGR